MRAAWRTIRGISDQWANAESVGTIIGGLASKKATAAEMSSTSAAARSRLNPSRTTTREHGDVGGIVRHRVRGNLPPLHPQPIGDVEHGEVRAVLHLEREHGDRCSVADEFERAHLGDRFRREHGEVAQAFHHTAVSVEAEPQEVVVLTDELVARAREVQRERGHVAAEVVDVEHQVLGQILLAAPDDESDPGVDEPVLVTGHVDRLHLGRRKSHFRSGCRNGATKPPLAASMCSAMSRPCSSL